LEVLDGQRRVELGRPKQRILLAILLVRANQVVALDRLVEELWGEQPPAQATLMPPASWPWPRKAIGC
jgi:DNA-binding SARP family transcriptional activator